MKSNSLTDSDIAKIILNDCLELKIEDSKFSADSYPNLERVFEYTKTRYGIPNSDNDFLKIIHSPFEFAIFLATLDKISTDQHTLSGVELYGNFIDLWISREVDKLILSDELPSDGHDISLDILDVAKFVGTLAHTEKEMKDPMSKLLEQFRGDDEGKKDLIKAFNACPLRKNPNGSYVFIAPSIGNYLSTTDIFEKLKDESHTDDRKYTR